MQLFVRDTKFLLPPPSRRPTFLVTLRDGPLLGRVSTDPINILTHEVKYMILTMYQISATLAAILSKLFDFQLCTPKNRWRVTEAQMGRLLVD